jgi:hypothetical protein
MSPVRRVCFWLSLPVALFFMVGGLFALPLERHRHSSTPAWLLYTVLRFALPGAILGFCIVWFVRRISH